MRKAGAKSDFCKRILKFSKGIRFAGIVNRSGEIVMGEYRKGVRPLLSRMESESHIKQSARRMQTMKALHQLFTEQKLGKIVYSYLLFENVKRATIPLKNSILVLSFDKAADHESIIMKKILPFARRHYPH
ncbi:MAG: hypothetical protein ACE5KA_03995 [Nitrososphaerales archaeon]